jgi:hypothetical protein
VLGDGRRNRGCRGCCGNVVHCWLCHPLTLSGAQAVAPTGQRHRPQIPKVRRFRT